MEALTRNWNCSRNLHIDADRRQQEQWEQVRIEMAATRRY